jgi:hypothetical protein
MVVTAVTTLIVAALATAAMHFLRSLSQLQNYVDLDFKSSLAFDRMTREIRQADAVQDCSSSALTLRLGTNLVTYVHDRTNRTLVRADSAVRRTLLRDCDYLRFDLFQRNTTNGTYDYYPAAAPNNAKVVQLTWICSRDVLGTPNSSSMQSAQIVIRKQRS